MSFMTRLNTIIAAVPHGDKIAHGVGGAVIAQTLVSVGVDPMNASHAATWVGILKEVFDDYHPDKHTSDVWDIIATAGGGAAIAAINHFGGWKWLISLV